MRTFWIQTLGCRVNHYEAQQMAGLLRSWGLVEATAPQYADLRIVHSCAVTTQAAGKSRQALRRMLRLPVLVAAPPKLHDGFGRACKDAAATDCDPIDQLLERPSIETNDPPCEPSSTPLSSTASPQFPAARVVMTGCYASHDPNALQTLPLGVDAVIGHDRDVAAQLNALLETWLGRPMPHPQGADQTGVPNATNAAAEPESNANDGWMKEAGTPVPVVAISSQARSGMGVKGKLDCDEKVRDKRHDPGAVTLPLLDRRQTGYQRAFLKVQDGCDAHCTYCIIPRLRPGLWSKPVDDILAEAQRLVDAGHGELVITGIFLGAYGQPTALRRRQSLEAGEPLARLVEMLCTRVRGLRRLRLSSLEPGDLGDRLLRTLASHPQVVGHLHLPLQSGSETLLRRMNRQYGRDDYLRMIDRVAAAFDRPAITTDIIVGFPGETDDEFERTLEVVRHARFMHVHAFSYSPRPGTPAARWTAQFVRGPVVNQRIALLNAMAGEFSAQFRRQFLGQEVEVLVERESTAEQDMQPLAGHRHGRCPRYFAVHFPVAPGHRLEPGAAVRVRVEQVTPTHTLGTSTSSEAGQR